MDAERAFISGAADAHGPDEDREPAALRSLLDELLARQVVEDGPPEVWAIIRRLLEAGRPRRSSTASFGCRSVRGFSPRSGGPVPGAHNSHRGGPLADRNAATITAIAELSGVVDGAIATAVWDVAPDVRPWKGPPGWIHGDLLPANLLVRAGGLSAVLDFGCLGAGDPACDVMAAWMVLDAGSLAMRSGTPSA